MRTLLLTSLLLFTPIALAIEGSACVQDWGDCDQFWDNARKRGHVCTGLQGELCVNIIDRVDRVHDRCSADHPKDDEARYQCVIGRLYPNPPK